MYGITATVHRLPSGPCWCQKPGAHRLMTRRNKGVTVMEIAMLLFFIAIAIASVTGLTVDSRDSGDWKPTTDGVRTTNRW